MKNKLLWILIIIILIILLTFGVLFIINGPGEYRINKGSESTTEEKTMEELTQEAADQREAEQKLSGEESEQEEVQVPSDGEITQAMAEEEVEQEEASEPVVQEMMGVFEGALVFEKRNTDGTFACCWSKEALLPVEEVENAQVGDIITSVNGVDYEVITQYEVEELDDMDSRYYKYGVFRVDGEKPWDCYYLQEKNGGNYAVIYPDGGFGICEDTETFTATVADDAQIKMTCFEGNYDGEYLTTLRGKEFKEATFIVGNEMVADPVVNGNKLYDYMTGIAGYATVEDGVITSFKQFFAE